MDITRLTDIFNADKEANMRSLMEYKEAVKYYHGYQLPAEALARLEARRQAPIIENIYKMIVNKILGYKIQSVQEVRVFGRTEANKHKANLLSQTDKGADNGAHNECAEKNDDSNQVGEHTFALVGAICQMKIGRASCRERV